MHFRNTVAPYNCYDDLKNQSALRPEFKKRGIGDYDKGYKDIFRVVSNEIETARQRAKMWDGSSYCESYGSYLRI